MGGLGAWPVGGMRGEYVAVCVGVPGIDPGVVVLLSAYEDCARKLWLSDEGGGTRGWDGGLNGDCGESL